MAGLQAIAAGVLVLLAAYCLGSLPTALVVSRITAHADIRELGDGNMGARNSRRALLASIVKSVGRWRPLSPMVLRATVGPVWGLPSQNGSRRRTAAGSK